MGDDHIGLRAIAGVAGDGERGLGSPGDSGFGAAGVSGLGVCSETFSCEENGTCCRGDRGLRIGDQGLSNGEGGASPDGRGLMGDGFCRAVPLVECFLPVSNCLRRYCTTSV